MKSIIPSFVLFAGALLAGTSFAEEPRHLLVAKFTLARFEKVGLTEQQRAEFNRLSAQLRKEIDALRKQAGISKEVMARRDEVHRNLKGLKLKEDAYWKRLKTDADLTQAQLDAFAGTASRYQEFKRAALALLSDEQRSKLPKPGSLAKKKSSGR